MKGSKKGSVPPSEREASNMVGKKRVEISSEKAVNESEMADWQRVSNVWERLLRGVAYGESRKVWVK